MEYLEWNNLIAKHFFNENNCGREVFLYVNDEIINSLGKPFNCGVDDFINSIKDGPNWIKNEFICVKALELYRNWRKIDLKFEYPPYIGYLAFFVLAGVTETEYASHSYYPGLWKRLGKSQNIGAPQSFYLMKDLWNDLEVWSREDKKEELGRFVVRIRGGYSHVGIPWSQTLLSESERKFLPSFFDLTELDPTDAPSPEIICKLLRTHGGEFLNNRTMRLFYDYDKNVELRNALSQYALDELEDWDGTIKYKIEEKETSLKSGIQTGLRICLYIDSVAKTVESYFRFKTTRMYPEDGLNLKYKGDERLWSCNEEYGGWSQPFRFFDVSPPERLNASLFDWHNSIQFLDEENRWRARLRGTNTRVFLLNLDRLPGWIESQRLERGIEFLVATSGEDIEKVIDWGANYCDSFTEFVFSGLPEGWRLFHGKNAKESCPDIDVLFISSQARLVIKGGLKAYGILNFFSFAPPYITIENSSGDEQVKLNGNNLIRKDDNKPIWELPEDTKIDVPLRIEANIGNQIQRKNIWLVNFTMPSNFKTPHKDEIGNICDEKNISNSVCGAIVCSDDRCTSYPNLLPIHLSHRIVFIGEHPGEIVDWPGEPLNMDWQPVWALAKKGKKNWEIHFCGNEKYLYDKNQPRKPISNRKNQKKWRQAIWINRKRNIPPGFPILKSLWERYLGAAKNV